MSGTASQASNGFIAESDSKETSSLSIPGKWNPAACTMYPVDASIATRECLSSAARNHARVSSFPSCERRSGSKFLAGAVAPPISSREACATVFTAYFGEILVRLL